MVQVKPTENIDVMISWHISSQPECPHGMSCPSWQSNGTGCSQPPVWTLPLLPGAFACWWRPCVVTWDAVPKHSWYYSYDEPPPCCLWPLGSLFMLSSHQTRALLPMITIVIQISFCKTLPGQRPDSPSSWAPVGSSASDRQLAAAAKGGRPRLPPPPAVRGQLPVRGPQANMPASGQQRDGAAAQSVRKRSQSLSSAVRNTSGCVPVSIPRRYLIVTPARLPRLVYLPWLSFSAWAFVARGFLLGLGFRSLVFLILLELS